MTYTISREAIHLTAQRSEVVRAALEYLFPEAFEPEIRPAGDAHLNAVATIDGREEVSIRISGQFANKALRLDEGRWNWEFKRDENKHLCLVPVRKL